MIEAGASLKQRMQPKHRGTFKCTLLDCVALSLASLGLLLAALSLSRDEPPSQQEQPHVANYSGDSAVLETYKWLQDGSVLQQLQPAVYGPVNKSGMVERLHWSQEDKYAVAREAIFKEWRQRDDQQPLPALQPGQAVTCAAARHPPVPHHHCHVFVNHEYKVAYIRSPKSSSTSIMNWLGQCRYNKTNNWNSTTCMEYSWEKHETLDSIKNIWQDYFFFGFIRNPWNRAYSLYKDIMRTNHFKLKHGPACSLDWDQFCHNPFGEWDRIHNKNCTRVEAHYAYWHMMDQYHCMVNPTGGWAVDFLGRVEAGDEDWRVVVEEMNRRRRPGVPEVPVSSYGHLHAVKPEQQPPQMSKRHIKSEEATSKTIKRLLGLEGDQKAEGHPQQPTSSHNSCAEADGPYCGSHAHCIDAVSQWYACDVEHFGYLARSAATATPVPKAQGSYDLPAAKALENLGRTASAEHYEEVTHAVEPAVANFAYLQEQPRPQHLLQ